MVDLLPKRKCVGTLTSSSAKARRKQFEYRKRVERFERKRSDLFPVERARTRELRATSPSQGLNLAV